MKKLKTKNESSKIKVFNFYTMVFLFLFCIFCSTATLAYAETASKQISDKDDEKTPFLLLEKTPKTNLSRQLWQARISPAKDTNSRQRANELQQIIKQLNSIEFKTKEQTPEPLITVEPIQKTEHNEIPANIETTQAHKPEKTEPKLPYKQVTDQTLLIVRNLSQHPDKLDRPLELAEILFDSNCLAEAAKCYQQAFDRMTTNETHQLTDKAWILFQMGNCLQYDNAPKAIQMYKQIITEYPDSPWTNIAKAKYKLIDWYLKDKPNMLINEHKS